MVLEYVARGAQVFGSAEKSLFWQISRVSVFASRTECNSAKNATLDASAAAHTAENEAKEVFLVLT